MHSSHSSHHPAPLANEPVEGPDGLLEGDQVTLRASVARAGKLNPERQNRVREALRRAQVTSGGGHS